MRCHSDIIFVNLAAEMARKCIPIKKIATILNICWLSAKNKLAGKSTLSVIEAYKIRDELFPFLMIDYLFDTKPRYDNIDVFNFPRKRKQIEVQYISGSNNKPDGCA